MSTVNDALKKSLPRTRRRPVGRSVLPFRKIASLGFIQSLHKYLCKRAKKCRCQFFALESAIGCVRVIMAEMSMDGAHPVCSTRMCVKKLLGRLITRWPASLRHLTLPETDTEQRELIGVTAVSEDQAEGRTLTLVESSSTSRDFPLALDCKMAIVRPKWFCSRYISS